MQSGDTRAGYKYDITNRRLPMPRRNGRIKGPKKVQGMGSKEALRNRKWDRPNIQKGDA